MAVKLLLLIIAIVLLACAIIFSCLPAGRYLINPEVCFNPPAGGCFSVELAETAGEQAKGLMGRQSLDENKAMLFIFEQDGVYPFWMKGTLIPLDIIWIDKDRKVVFINKNSQPCLPAQTGGASDCPVINPGVKAKYVLEINAGISEKTGLAIGDELELNIR